jgi:AcrR family transcriptional regulator
LVFNVNHVKGSLLSNPFLYIDINIILDYISICSTIIDYEGQIMKKRSKILNTTIKLFVEKDIKKVTMDDIAARANVSKMTVYKYFLNKESLYETVGKEVLDSCYDALTRQYETPDTAVHKMIGCTSVLVDFIAKGHLALCHKLSDLNEDVGGHLAHFNTDVKKIMISLIKEGKKGALIRKDISNECIYHYINMGMYYFQHNAEYRNKMIYEPSFREEYMTFLWSHIFIDFSGFTS